MIRYYYLRDDEDRPRVTICLIKDGNYIAKGVSICSWKDNPNKKVGKKIAFGRAHKALVNSKSYAPIERHEAQDILDQLGVFYYTYRGDKGIYNPYLTTYEKKLLGVT